MKILDYVDNKLEQIKKLTGTYPKNLELTKETIKKMKEELKDYSLDNCWAEKFPNNYRGIPIIIKEKNND